MNGETKNAIQSIVNDLLSEVPTKAVVEGGELEIDYALVGQGIVIEEKFISVLMDGTTHPSSKPHKDEKDKNFNMMPVHVDEGQPIQVLLSEYVLNSFMISVVDLEWYEYSFNFKSDNVEAIIKDFEEAFGEIDNCTLSINAADNYKNFTPSVRITPTGSTIEMLLEFHIKNPFNPKLDAAFIVVKTTANVMFTVEEDFRLTGDVSTVEMEAIDFLPYFKTSTTIKNINS